MDDSKNVLNFVFIPCLLLCFCWLTNTIYKTEGTTNYWFSLEKWHPLLYSKLPSRYFRLLPWNNTVSDFQSILRFLSTWKLSVFVTAGTTGCLPCTQRFLEVLLISEWKRLFGSFQYKISWSNGTSEKVVSVFADGLFQAEILVPFVIIKIHLWYQLQDFEAVFQDR